MSTKTTLADLLRAEIEAAGHRQYEIAAKLGISQKHLSQMVCGKVGLSLTLVDQILELCGRRLVVGTEPITEVPEPDADLRAMREHAATAPRTELGRFTKEGGN